MSKEKRATAKSLRRRQLRSERLERRDLLAGDVGGDSTSFDSTSFDSTGDLVAEGESNLSITLDFQFAPAGFFTGPLMNAIQDVADEIASRLDDTLGAINPPTDPEIVWTPRTINPSTGNEVTLPQSFSVAENELVIFVGARSLPGNTIGEGGLFEGATNTDANRLEGLSTLMANCTDQACVDEANAFIASLSRGQTGALTPNATETAPLVGFVTFDSDTTFFSGVGEAPDEEISIRDVAAHEIAHALGFATGFAWRNLTSTGSFTGPNANAVFPGGANVPLQLAGNGVALHWANSVVDVVPSTLTGTPDGQLSDLDFAGLEDLGWDVLPRPIPTVQLTNAPASAAESDTVSLTATLSSLSSTDVTVSLSTSGTASQSDFDLPANIVIPAGSLSASVDLTITDDDLFEPSETVIVSISSPQNATLGTTVSDTITIAADPSDPQPSFQLATDSSQIVEGNSGTQNVQIAVELVGGVLDVPAEVDFSVTGTADAMDFSVVTTGPLVFNPGQTSTTITLAVSGDTEFEPDETITVTLNSPTVAALGGANQTTITIENDDVQPQIAQINQTTANADEGEVVNLTVSLSREAESEVSLPFTITGPTGDFTAITASPLLIPQGGNSATISVMIVQDDFFDPGEEIIVTLGQPTPASITLNPNQNSSTITINDSDPPPSVQFTTASQTVVESTETIDLEIALANTLESATSVPFEILGTAQSGQDFQLQSTSPLNIAVGQTTATISIDLLSDLVFEPPRTIVVNLLEPTGVTQLGANVSNTITIVDSTPEPVQAGFVATTLSSPEDDGTVSVAVSLNQTFANDVSIPVTIGGTATAGADFVVPNATIDIPAGSSTGALSVEIIDDTIVDPGETIVLTLNAADGVTIDPANSTATLTIVDDDVPPPPTVTFDVTAATVSESDGEVSFGLTLSEASDAAITIPFTVSGTATGSDFELLTTSPLSIPAGSTTATINLRIDSDSELDLDETIVLTLGSSAGATVGANPELAITIIDVMPPAAQIEFSVASQTVSESIATPVIVTASLSEPVATDVTGNLSFGGTATADADFSVGSASFTIPAGQTSVDVPITILDDLIGEPTETIEIGFQDIVGGTVGSQATQTISILNTDPPVDPGPPGTSRILIPQVAARAHFIPGDGQPTAILFRALADTVLTTTPIGTVSLTDNIQFLNVNLESIGEFRDGVFSADLVQDELYAVILPGLDVDSLYSIRSSEGPDSLVGSGDTNILNPTDVNANGETTAQDALLVLNQLPASTNPEGELSRPIRSDRFYDVDGNGTVGAIDVLRVINQLTRPSATPVQSGFAPSAFLEGESLVDDEIDQAIESVLSDVVDNQNTSFAQSESQANSGDSQDYVLSTAQSDNVDRLIESEDDWLVDRELNASIA